jgi:hypothetical protein
LWRAFGGSDIMLVDVPSKSNELNVKGNDEPK